MNLLFDGRSIVERGTLAQIRNAFGHRNVTTDVMNSYNYVDDFTRFLTEAHIVYLVMEICHMANINDIPQGSIPRGTADRRKRYLNTQSREVVRRVWSAPTPSDVNQVLEAEVPGANDQWCLCGNDGKHLKLEVQEICLSQITGIM